MKRYVYVLSEDELGELLAEKPVPIEVLRRKEGKVEFALYEPLGYLQPVRVEEVSEDWKHWKKSFGPVDVEDFVIMPPWKTPVFIKPGMAFGTGLHPTTKMCIRLLKEVLKEGDSLLDVGCGSGILSIVAKLFGASRVVGIDMSEDAVRESLENAKLNGVSIEVYSKTPSELEEKFEVVVANLEMLIFRKELRNILPLMNRAAVFSGIYKKEELEEFLHMIEQEGSKADRILEDEDWFCIGVGDGWN